MRAIRTDSLFVRLLLMQGVLVGAAMLIFGIVLIAERSVLLARPHAVLWAPAFRQVAALPVGAWNVPAYDLADGVRREPGPPAGPRLLISWLPGVQALRAELAEHGIELETVWATLGRSGLTYFGQVAIDGAAPVWVSAGGDSMLPGWSMRMSGGLIALLLLIVAIGYYFVRRVTHPLAQLHDRMLGHADTGAALAPPTPVSDRRKLPPELLAMERAYTTLADKLDRNERERGLLLAGVSHDLRSPLARIRLAAEMLPEIDANTEGVAAISRNVDQADRLIASFLEFVRGGTQALDETVEAVAVIRKAVAGFNRPPQELSVQLPERMLLHGCSALLLDRLVVNLVDNALQHGGLPVQLHLACEGVTAQLTVADSGPGLPPDGAERLMEAFARGDASRGVPGFGLGLASVQQIVTRLQGRLHFDHSAQDGNRAVVAIPLSR